MSCPAQVRLPVEDLIVASGADKVIARNRAGHLQVPAPFTVLASRVGVRPRTVHRWIAEGGIPLDAADLAAVRCGRHPSEVWGDLWWSACHASRDRDLSRAARVETARERRELVAGYTRVERARERGPHRCAIDGCCARDARRGDAGEDAA